jgi:hypothetical protein
LGAITPWLCSTELLGTPSSDQHKKIRTCEKHVKPVQVLLEPSVSCLSVTKVPLHYEKGMFHFTANRRLAVFNELVPVEAFEGISRFQAAWALGDLKSHAFQVLIIGFCNTLCDSKITGISV